MLLFLLLGVFFVACGCLFFSRYALRWVSGWQALSKAEQEQVRIVPLCHNLGGALALAGLIFLAGGYFPEFRESGFRWTMVGWFVLCILDVLYIDRSGRYLEQADERRLD